MRYSVAWCDVVHSAMVCAARCVVWYSLVWSVRCVVCCTGLYTAVLWGEGRPPATLPESVCAAAALPPFYRGWSDLWEGECQPGAPRVCPASTLLFFIYAALDITLLTTTSLEYINKPNTFFYVPFRIHSVEF